MQDSTEPLETPAKNPYAGIKRALIALGILTIIWLAFGKLMPMGGSMQSRMEAPLRPSSNTQLMAERIGALEDRITDLEARVKSYEDKAAALPSPIDDVERDARLAEWQASIEARMEELQQAPSDIQANQQQLEQLQKRISDSESKAGSKLAALTAFAQLKDAISRGNVYAGQLKSLNSMTQDNEAAREIIAKLAPQSDKGLANIAELQKSFSRLVPKALSAGKRGSVLGNVGTLVQVRKVGEEQQGTDDESILARAEAKLMRGDLDACLQELTQLSPPAATTFTDWTTQAQEIQRTQTLLDTLQLALTDALPSAEPATTPEAKSE
jgi:hypothetical protein